MGGREGERVRIMGIGKEGLREGLREGGKEGGREQSRTCQGCSGHEARDGQEEGLQEHGPVDVVGEHFFEICGKEELREGGRREGGVG